MSKISLGIERDTVVRRYMSLDKFEKLLSSQGMYFSRFDSFEDKLEGGINQKNYPNFSNSLEVLDLATSVWPGNYPRDEKSQATIRNAQQKIEQETFPSLFGIQQKINGDAYLQNVRSWLYASCWTDMPHECQAMWQLYGSSGSSCRHEIGCMECENTLGNSICIETTIGSIVDNLNLKTEYNLSIQKVEYLDHRKTKFDGDDIISRPFFSKALHFSYEHEVRFLLWPNRDDISFSYKHMKSSKNKTTSELLHIDNLESFIGKIILSPLPFKREKAIRSDHAERFQSTLGLQEALANATLRDKIQKACTNHNLNIPIVDSELNQISPTDCYSYFTDI
ncbi:TPA: hypothetical protein QDZ23_004261 [Pseudomonas putida]|nr:hypothetical protein [Pseudomonas putida]